MDRLVYRKHLQRGNSLHGCLYSSVGSCGMLVFVLVKWESSEYIRSNTLGWGEGVLAEPKMVGMARMQQLMLGLHMDARAATTLNRQDSILAFFPVLDGKHQILHH